MISPRRRLGPGRLESTARGYLATWRSADGRRCRRILTTDKRIDAHGRRATIHGLRHSFCSMLARANVGLAQAQKLMGHSDPRLTAEVYTHPGVEDLKGRSIG